MSQDEFPHINRLIAEVGKTLGWPSGKELSQRDFEFLIESVYAKTKIRVSLSTIKRIWTHGNEYLPRVSTLDILAQYLGYPGWHVFKAGGLRLKAGDPISRKAGGLRLKWWLWVIGVVVAVLLVVFIIKMIPERPLKYDHIEFSLDRIIGDSVPVTAVFNYDLSEVDFDSAFIQLSWNEREREQITKEEHVLTAMYYFPGIHEAKLIIDDSIVKTTPVYIRTADWLSLYRSEPDEVVPIYLRDPEIQQHGVLSANAALLSTFKADTSRESYFVSYFNSRDFQLSADAFSFTTRIKNPISKGKFHCQVSSIYIYAERSGVFFSLSQPGCVGEIGVAVGDTLVSGKRNDLSALGLDLNQWHEIKGLVKDQMFHLFVNDSMVLEIPFSMQLGKLLTWQYFFMGNGAVDFLTIEDSTGQIVFHDDF